MMEISQNRKPLVENDNLTSSSAAVTYSNGVLTKNTMENQASTSELAYFELLFLISHHIHSPSGRLENPLSYMY